MITNRDLITEEVIRPEIFSADVVATISVDMHGKYILNVVKHRWQPRKKFESTGLFGILKNLFTVFVRRRQIS